MKNIQQFTFTLFILLLIHGPIFYIILWNQPTLLGFKLPYWIVFSTVLLLVTTLFVRYYKIGYPERPVMFKQKIPILIMMVGAFIFLFNSRMEQPDYLDYKIEKSSSLDTNNNSVPIEKKQKSTSVELSDARKAYLKRHSIDPEKAKQYTNADIDFLIKLEPFHEEIVKWEREQFGYFLTTSYQSDYNSYSIDELEALADQNDLKALDRLSQIHMENLDSQQSLKFDRRAAVLGSTWALRQIAMKTDGFSMTQEGRHKQIMTKLSYLQAAHIRGDKSSVRNTATALLLYENELNEQDIQAIQSRGKKIIADLENERAKMGLEPFDNSVPWYVDDFNNWVNQKVIDNTGVESPLYTLNY